MPLTADRDVELFASLESLDLPVDDNVIIYRGAFVGRNRTTGYFRPLVAGDEFVGIAYRKADNTVAGHTAGGITARVYQQIDITHALSGLVDADIGKEVYASDDSTLTLTPTGNSRIGRIVAVDSSNVARVRAQPLGALDGLLDNRPIRTLADANATLTLDHINRVLLMGNSAARTLTLPPVATVRAGAWMRVVKTSAAAFAITLDANAAELIDGATTLGTLDAQYDTVHICSTGSEWIVLDRDIA